MEFFGTATCKSEEEMLSVLGRLATVPNIEVNRQSLNVTVSYSPKDTETSREEEETIAKITDVIESVATHGIVIC